LHEVAFLVLEDGDAPAEIYLKRMQLPPYKKLVARIERAANNGIPINTEQARQFQTPEGWTIRELKIFGHRMIWDWGPRGEIVLLHGFAKKPDETPRNELQRAVTLIELLRHEGGIRDG